MLILDYTCDRCDFGVDFHIIKCKHWTP